MPSLTATAVPPASAGSARLRRAPPGGVPVNDVHSRLNPTRVHQELSPASAEEVHAVLAHARALGRPVCVAGSRHAMGGQQFAEGAVLLDTRRLSRVSGFDAEHGTVEVGAGIEWPALIRWLLAAQRGHPEQWGIRQKQSGADRLTLGGAIAANAHGRGLWMPPFVDDVEAFELVDAQGRLLRCSRLENVGLFRLVVGGYGLFGVVTSVTLRLAPRQKVRRQVEVVGADELLDALERRLADGHLYGDFQFNTDERSADFLARGVLSTYRPVAWDTPIPDSQRALTGEEWSELAYLAHADKERAFRRYVEHYRSTSGQIYWSDTHQLSTYLDDYHRSLDRRLGAVHPGTEVIGELFVPRDELTGFLAEAREELRAHGADLVYGTIRLVERDRESFLAWAREPYACVVLNLHTEHTPRGRERTAETFRRLIDRAARRRGSYYLTYHRHATREQVLACYPQFPEFLRRKRAYDPEEVFQSDWYRHHARLFAAG